MTDSLQKIIERLKTVSASLSELGSILASGELVDNSATVLECAESLSALQGEPFLIYSEYANGNFGISRPCIRNISIGGKKIVPIKEIPLYAAPPQADGVVVPRAVLDFLLGVGKLDGVWFGDSDTSIPRPRYWWRHYIQKAMLAAAEVKSIGEPAAKPGKE